MNTKKLLITVCFFAISGAAIGQSMEQKFQEADAELNRVYKELRGKLNEQQKSLLKKSQQAWIKDKENYANGAPSAEEKLRILTGVTIERIADLKSGDLEYPPTGIQTDDSESSEVGADISDQDIAEILIGKWVHFEKRMHARVQFKPDGTYVQTELTPQTDETERSTGTWRIEKVHLVFRPNGEEESEPTELTINNSDSISYDHYHFDREKD